ncbi:ABC transporter substrate-binding protein [Streptomyces netropsis]|uniref:ABC transporter substrate-binding protein n=1 Tax=Streptomyces netropsis TaxID=55404 RepID=UPI0037915914
MARIRPRITVAPALATAAALLMCSCSAGAGKGAEGAKGGATAAKSGQRLTAALGTAADSRGPAPAVSGARSGGTVKVANLNDYSHLDPQKIYAGEGYSTSLLWGRQLTQYQVVDGRPKLVGDLATDTGKSSDGGRTWTYRLKDGVAWEDGKPITSAHIKYGIERTFAPGFELGPTYWPEWLTDSEDRSAAVKKYGGPKDGDLKAIETPDDKTIVFRFPKPQSDVPYMAAQSSSSPVREDANSIRYANPEVDKELERIAGIGDAQQKADALIALERTVMKDVPVVPFLYTSVSQFRGANIGGAAIHPIYGSIAAASLYVKKS